MATLPTTKADELLIPADATGLIVRFGSRYGRVEMEPGRTVIANDDGHIGPGPSADQIESAQDYARAAQGDTVALVESTAAGILAVADGETFAVSADSTLSLYRRDGSSATLLMADYLPNAPLVPQVAPSAPALVTSLQTMKTQGVPLKALVGKNYAGSTDASAQLNSCFEDLCGEEIKVHDRDAMTILLEDQLYLRSNMVLDMTGTEWVKGTAEGGINNALFRHVVLDDDISNLRWRGDWKVTLASTSMNGVIFRFFANRFEFSGGTIEGYKGGQAFFFGGHNGVMDRMRVESAYEDYGDGAFRFGYGTDCVFTRLWARCWDDNFQVLPAADSGGMRDSLPVRNITYRDCIGDSRSRLMIVALGARQGVNAYSGTVRGVMFDGIRGICNRIISVGNANEVGGGSDQFDNIRFRNIDARLHQTNTDGDAQTCKSLIYLGTSTSRNVGRVVIDGLRCSSANVNYGFDLNALDARLLARNVDISYRLHAVFGRRNLLADFDGFDWIGNGGSSGASPDEPTGGDGDPPDEGDGSGEDDGSRTAVFNRAAASGTDITIRNGSIRDVQSSYNGAYFAAGTLRVDNVEVKVASGATGNRTFVTSNSATLYLESERSDVDTPGAYGSGTVHRARSMAVSTTATIASGVVVVTGTSMTIDTEGGASTDDLDTLTAPSWLTIGEDIVITPANSARDIVIKHGTGNIYCPGGADQTLNYNTESAVLKWTGSRWLLLSAHNPA